MKARMAMAVLGEVTASIDAQDFERVSLDPAFHEFRAWNEGRVLEAKRTHKPHQVWVEDALDL